MAKTDKRSTGYYIGAAAAIFVMFFFGKLVPTWSAVTPVGVGVLGVFLGVILAIFVTGDTLWPSVVAMAALTVNGYFANFNAAIGSVFGIPVVYGFFLVTAIINCMNDSGTGEALASSGVPREQLFLSSKVPNKPPYHESPATVRDSIKERLRRMRTDYFDMLLIHHAVPGKTDLTGDGLVMDVECVCMIWDVMTDLMRQGVLRGIGVSNFNIEHLRQLMEHTSVVPMVNQIRCNPACRNSEVIALCKEKGVQPIAHSPLSFSVAPGVFKVDEDFKAKLSGVGEKYGKSWAQVQLRYNFQNGVAAIPRSSKKKNQAASLDIFNFALTEDEMLLLSK